MSEKKPIIIQSFILVITIMASLLSGYLLIDHYELSSSSSVLSRLCTVSETLDCNKVNASSYSSLLGVPVASFGLFFYAFVTAMMVLIFFVKDDGLIDLIKGVLLVTSFISVLVILPLLYISIFKIKALCTFCISTWVCSLCMFLLILHFINDKADSSLFPAIGKTIKRMTSSFSSASKHATPVALFGLTSLVVFISVLSFTGYLGMKSEIEKVRMSLSELDKHLSSFHKRKVYDLNTDNLPVSHGDPDAKLTLVVYSDFNCSACRRSVPMMDKLVERFHGKLKVYHKNFPLDSQCNPIVTKPKGEVGLSCRAALISVALRETDGYLKYVNHIMRSKKKLSDELVKSAIKASGVDEQLLLSKLKDKNTQEKLKKEMKDAFVAGVTSTPSIFLNGRLLGKGLPQKYILDRLIHLELSRDK